MMLQTIGRRWLNTITSSYLSTSIHRHGNYIQLHMYLANSCCRINIKLTSTCYHSYHMQQFNVRLMSAPLCLLRCGQVQARSLGTSVAGMSPMKSKSNTVTKSTSRRADKVIPAVLNSLRQDVLCGDNYKNTVYRKSLLNIFDDSDLDVSKTSPLVTADISVLNDLAELTPQQIVKALIQLKESVPQWKYDRRMLMYEKYVRTHMKQFTLDELLYICDVMYISGGDVEAYCRTLFIHVIEQWTHTNLRVHQAVQICFLISIIRNAPVVLLQFLEEFLADNHSQLTSKELSLVCNGFYSSNRSIRNVTLLEGLWKTLLKDAANLPLVHCGNILKVLKHADYGQTVYYKTLGDMLCLRTDIHKPETLASTASIAVVYSGSKMKHDKLFTALSRGVIYAMKNTAYNKIRVKDLARYVLACSNLQVKPHQKIIQNLEERLRKDSWVAVKFPEVYLEALVALAILDRYPDDVISQVFSPVSIKHKQGMVPYYPG